MVNLSTTGTSICHLFIEKVHDLWENEKNVGT